MTTIDDARLIQIAGDQPQPLLPVLDRARSYRPLIGVLAILPCLIALEQRWLDDIGATWALHAMDSEPTVRSAAFQWQPPLLTWIYDLLLNGTPLPGQIVPLIVSILGTMGIVWWSFRLFSSDEEERLGFWTALCLTFQGGLVLLATSGSPTVLVLLLILVTFDGWQRHFDETDATVSIWLLVAGAAWGLVTLAGGATTLLIPAVLIIEQLLREASDRRKPTRTKRARIRKQQRIRWAFSFLVALLASLAVSGWWLFRSMNQGGEEFLTAWWNGYDSPVLQLHDKEEFVTGLGPRIQKLIAIAGPMLPLAAVGGIRLVVEMIQGTDGSSQNGSVKYDSPDNRQLLLPWLMVGTVGFAVSSTPVSNQLHLSLADAFLLVPIAACAALAIVAILQREVSPFIVVTTVGSSAVVAVAVTTIDPRTQEATSRLLPAALTFLIVAIAAIALLQWSRDHEVRKRIALMAMLATQLTLIAWFGLQHAGPQSKDEQALDALRKQLSAGTVSQDSQPPVGSIIFVSREQPPGRLEFALRTLYPNASWRVARDWGAVTAGRLLNVDTESTTLIVDWLSPTRQTAPVDLGNPAAGFRFYRGRELRAFLVTPQTIADSR